MGTPPEDGGQRPPSDCLDVIEVQIHRPTLADNDLLVQRHWLLLAPAVPRVIDWSP